MIPIQYASSAAPLRLEYPHTWDSSQITGVEITVSGTDGTVLDSGDATIYTATTLDSASAIGDTSLSLASATATTLNAGDVIRIGGEHGEVAEVVSWNGTTYVVTVRHGLTYAYDAATVVTGMWATYDLDVDDTTVYPAGKELVISWLAPDLLDPAAVQLGRIEKSAAAPNDAMRRFRLLYPVEYRACEDLTLILSEAEHRLRSELEAKGLNFDRIIDTDVSQGAQLSLARLLILEGGGDGLTHELEVARNRYALDLDLLTRLPLWVDDDQNQTEDDSEVTDHIDYPMLRVY